MNERLGKEFGIHHDVAVFGEACKLLEQSRDARARQLLQTRSTAYEVIERKEDGRLACAGSTQGGLLVVYSVASSSTHKRAVYYKFGKPDAEHPTGGRGALCRSDGDAALLIYTALLRRRQDASRSARLSFLAAGAAAAAPDSSDSPLALPLASPTASPSASQSWVGAMAHSLSNSLHIRSFGAFSQKNKMVRVVGGEDGEGYEEGTDAEGKQEIHVFSGDNSTVPTETLWSLLPFVMFANYYDSSEERQRRHHQTRNS